MSNETQQTAVDWLKKQLEDYGSTSHLILDWGTFDELCEQAKEMEKEQMTKAWKAGDGQHDKVADKLAEEWYNETYGGNK